MISSKEHFPAPGASAPAPVTPPAHAGLASVSFETKETASALPTQPASPLPREETLQFSSARAAAAGFEFSERIEGPSSARAAQPVNEKVKTHKFSIDTADFVALGFLALCLGACVIGILITVGMVFCKFDASIGTNFLVKIFGGTALVGIGKVVLDKNSKNGALKKD